MFTLTDRRFVVNGLALPPDSSIQAGSFTAMREHARRNWQVLNRLLRSLNPHQGPRDLRGDGEVRNQRH